MSRIINRYNIRCILHHLKIWTSYRSSLFVWKDNKKLKWKIEYEYLIYKIYDSDKKLAGYFFPQYNSLLRQDSSSKQQHEEEEEENEDELIERMNKARDKIMGGNLMVPMLSLSLLDY